MGGTGDDNDIRRIEIAYDPLLSQKLFHESEARFKGFSGPIGSGKSHALCQEAIRLSYINAGRLGLLGAPTYPMLRDATQATLFEIFVKGFHRRGVQWDQAALTKLGTANLEDAIGQ